MFAVVLRERARQAQLRRLERKLAMKEEKEQEMLKPQTLSGRHNMEVRFFPSVPFPCEACHETAELLWDCCVELLDCEIDEWEH